MKRKFELVLVSCSGVKLDYAAPARDLYCSQLFQASSKWAEANGRRWAILSAKHGILWPGQIVKPYDFTLKSKGKDTIRAWTFRIQADLCCLATRGRPVRTAVLAGGDYTRPLRMVGAIRGFAEPLFGLQIGQRLAWLKQQREQLASPSLAKFPA